jgi:hypothetical protein
MQRHKNGLRNLSSIYLHLENRATELSLDQFALSRNGLVFQSNTPMKEWTELSVRLQASNSIKEVRCSGVVVECKPSADGQNFDITLWFLKVLPKNGTHLLKCAINAAR